MCLWSLVYVCTMALSASCGSCGDSDGDGALLSCGFGRRSFGWKPHRVSLTNGTAALVFLHGPSNQSIMTTKRAPRTMQSSLNTSVWDI